MQWRGKASYARVLRGAAEGSKQVFGSSPSAAICSQRSPCSMGRTGTRGMRTLSLLISAQVVLVRAPDSRSEDWAFECLCGHCRR